MTKLRELRNSKGLQRKFVAESIGVSARHLNDIEIANVNLTDNIATKLAAVYGVDEEYLKELYDEVRIERYF